MGLCFELNYFRNRWLTENFLPLFLSELRVWFGWFLWLAVLMVLPRGVVRGLRFISERREQSKPASSDKYSVPCFELSQRFKICMCSNEKIMQRNRVPISQHKAHTVAPPYPRGIHSMSHFRGSLKLLLVPKPIYIVSFFLGTHTCGQV